MKLKKTLQEKIAEKRYLRALREEGEARIKFLEAVNEIQKAGGFNPWCFYGYPDSVPTCNDFKPDCKCKRKTCPAYPLNSIYIDVRKKYEESRITRYKADTAMIAAKVRE